MTLLPFSSYSFTMPLAKGKEIRARRQKLGLKLGQFCERYDVKYGTLANIESKSQSASIEILHKLASVFDCDVEELIANEDDEPEAAAAA